MAERDRFELDLAAFLRTYAEDAPTDVRPAELAHHFAEAYPHGRGVTARWSFRPSPALAWILLLAGLLLALVAGALHVGSRLLERAPMRTEEFLSGMVTEEVEPGVVRVLHDGYRDLTHPAEVCERVIVGDSDQIWRTTGCWRLFRLGQAGEWDYDPEVVHLGWGQGFASLDGRLWSLEAAGRSPRDPYYLRLFDDGAWVADPRVGEASHGQIHVEDDGTVWVLGTDGAIHWSGETAARSSSWRDVWVPDRDRDMVTLLSVTDDGVAWFITEPQADGSIVFLRFDGTDWEVVPGPEGFGAAPRHQVGILSAGVSPDGVLWTAGDSQSPHVSLARLDDEGWVVFTATSGVQPWGGRPGGWGTTMDTLRVAPDGSAWVDASGPRHLATGDLACHGLARFDGDSWQSFFSGDCISDLDFAPDGTVWVVAEDEDREVGTYVITPEAVAATKARDADSDAAIATLSGRAGPVTDVAWSLDGTRLATATGDGNARVWLEAAAVDTIEP